MARCIVLPFPESFPEPQIICAPGHVLQFQATARNAKLHKRLDKFLLKTADHHIRMHLLDLLDIHWIEDWSPNLHKLLNQILSHVGPERIEESFRSLKAILVRPITARVELSFKRPACCEQWRALLAEPHSSGSIVFEDFHTKRQLEIPFELWPLDAKFSELSLSGPGIVAQHILVRRTVNKGLRWRFYCSRCERTRFDELVLFHESPTPEFLCGKCPEFYSNWEAWRCRGASYHVEEIRSCGETGGGAAKHKGGAQ
jgi:hypothetical protein